MIKVYICPNCGWLRKVSRRKEVECFKCGEVKMKQATLTYEDISRMSETEIEDYIKGWLYIHGRKKQIHS